MRPHTRGAVRIDGEVADLARDAGRTTVDVAVDDVATADAGPDLDKDEVAAADTPAPPELGQRPEVGVVVHEDGAGVDRFQARCDVDVAPARHHERRDRAGMFRIDGARDTHADSDQALVAHAGVIEGLADEFVDQRKRALGVGPHVVASCLPGAGLAAQVGDDDAHV